MSGRKHDAVATLAVAMKSVTSWRVVALCSKTPRTACAGEGNIPVAANMPHKTSHQSSTKFLTAVLSLVLILSLAPVSYSRTQPAKEELDAQVRDEFMHAWNGYKKYAWGHDDLRPLSKTYHDWYAEPLLMTPVDSLDTMIIMGLDDEARNTREYIVKNLSFDKDFYVQNFEITIRLLGGLLSSYQLTGDKRLLNLAEDLGNRLLPVFDSR